MAEAVVKLYRDHGNRADRKRARIKYLVADWGVEKFRQMLAEYAGGPLTPPREPAITDVDLHLGWHAQADGKWFIGISVENGRVKDEGTMRMRSGLRAIVEKFGPAVRVTAQQDLLLCDIDEANKPTVDAMLAEYGIPQASQVSLVQQWSMACPAIPTCGLAITESERALPGVIDQLETELVQLGLASERISVRMTGCPNGCARPYQSEIGLVGRSGDKYTLFLGGETLGTRLSFEAADLVKRDDIVPRLSKLLADYKANRTGDESFGDYCHKLGTERVRSVMGME
jgi:sulfite reductase (ferredoxin)